MIRRMLFADKFRGLSMSDGAYSEKGCGLRCTSDRWIRQYLVSDGGKWLEWGVVVVRRKVLTRRLDASFQNSRVAKSCDCHLSVDFTRSESPRRADPGLQLDASPAVPSITTTTDSSSVSLLLE